MKKFLALLVVLVVIVSAVLLIKYLERPISGHVKDEALLAGVKATDFKASDSDYFHDMDGGITLTSQERQGRNTWIVWTAGDDRLWDVLSVKSIGALDFLKTISSYPGLKASRDNRWDYLGLVNEPCFDKPTGPDPDRYGLWLDKRRADCPKDPFEDESQFPGVKYGARGKNIAAGSFYGYATGIMGLRLFPNPAFDEKAAKKWDPVRYYTDPTYYESKDLIKPYRVGMSCGFCHVGPNPVNPPADRNHPKFENLSSNVGAQYFWIDRIFDWSADDKNFIYQLFHTSRPGTLDTSLVSTDSINNPRTMNAVYLLRQRLEEAKRWGKETLSPANQGNRQLNDYVSTGPLSQYYKAPDIVMTPRVLKDGSDSVGVMGALNRVYLNIGVFSEEWLLHFNALVGGKAITPIDVKVARENSSYFAATENQTFATAAFFLKATDAHLLKDVHDHAGDKYLQANGATLKQGKIVFAENCGRCHSSKQPQPAPGMDPNGCAGKDYMNCWNRYWEWTKTAEYKDQMRQMVLADDFLKDNYLSSELRVPVTLLHTNACSPLATNALSGNIWDNFSSQSYKDLPSVGTITWYDPITGEPNQYNMPAGGRGYTRPASLVSVWSTAPFLQNNSVGPFDVDPSVDGRMRSFNASIEQMLWPEKRDHDSKLGTKVPGTIDRTTVQSHLHVPLGYLPGFLLPFYSLGQALAPWIFGEGGIQLGPIPTGTPVGLLVNLNPLPDDSDPAKAATHQKDVAKLVFDLDHDLKKLGPNATDEQASAVFRKQVPQLLHLSKCPDLVVNRGHYFGTDYVEPGESRESALRERGPGLSDQDKRALIEYLKTF
ncbi:hypothetical protein [Terriglobus saanensis]|uniref:Cytochrome c domain-containing protein n=1 Tax=Terriglobus saanensis (strain ATCC BAA-1853 / DSM 23119 / SP1PR4) TaxID=401053 RepID=E8V2G1_TERSS|nr:hypothetical protein [Terriglobus saanensis]ADV82379.1 hypothetical protein AciPR4_1558 [Terriglobus saanensis SP1PR4]